MKCPVDGQTLVMAERHNVEIDYCPECRGIWLDRGELDRIVENAAPKATPPPRRYDDDDDDRRRADGRYDDRYDDRYAKEQYPPRKKKKSPFSALSDLLGGDD